MSQSAMELFCFVFSPLPLFRCRFLFFSVDVAVILPIVHFGTARREMFSNAKYQANAGIEQR